MLSPRRRLDLEDGAVGGVDDMADAGGSTAVAVDEAAAAALPLRIWAGADPAVVNIGGSRRRLTLERPPKRLDSTRLGSARLSRPTRPGSSRFILVAVVVASVFFSSLVRMYACSLPR